MEPSRAIDIMRRNVITLAPDDSLAVAREIMRLGRLRQLPVVERGRMLGELSYRATCLALGDALGSDSSTARRRRRLEGLDHQPVSKLMVPPEWVDPDAPIGLVVRQLARRAAGYVPVVETGPRPPRMLGVVTERDLLRAAVADPPS